MATTSRPPIRKLSLRQLAAHKTNTDTTRRRDGPGRRARLSDPLQVADHTLNRLQKNRREEAVRYLHDHGKHQQVTVSWNHLIDHDIREGRIGLAFKTFNQMKKRGQKPDGYTYTILFRGLAKHASHSGNLERAIALYSSMFAENSAVKPSTIHTNAVLNVCALAQDSDAIFTITAKLPSFGPGSPDHVTYTTIFNCLRDTAWANGRISRHEENEAKLERRQVAVLQGRKIWLDVLDKWSRGMAMDERLVCAMGRLLLLGNTERDFDDVLSLVAQTMDLPREVPAIGDMARPTHLRPLIVSGSRTGTVAKEHSRLETSIVSEHDGLDGTEKGDATHRSLGATADSELVDGESGTDGAERTSDFSTTNEHSSHAMVPSTVFTESAVSTTSKGGKLYAKPGRNTLSLLIDACMRMNAVQPAHNYWAKLTTQFEPDLENYHAYLRLLRISRSSTAVLELLRDLEARVNEGDVEVKPEPKTYTIALSSCVRDGHNSTTLDTATEIMNMMLRNVDDPPLRAAEIYENVLSKKGASWSLKQMREATDALEQLWNNCRSVAAYGAWSPDTKHVGAAKETRDAYPLQRELDPDHFDTMVLNVDTRDGRVAKSGNQRVVTPRYRYAIFGVTKILRAQIQRVQNRFGMEMNQREDKQWRDRYLNVHRVLQRMGDRNEENLQRRRHQQAPNIYDTSALDSAEAS